jgi:carbonic anhydrase
VNIWKNPYIQKSWKKGHAVWVHGWIFRVKNIIKEL